jgi:hypothetical protein
VPLVIRLCAIKMENVPGSLFFRCSDTVSLLPGIDPLALFSRRGVGREKRAVPTTIVSLTREVRDRRNEPNGGLVDSQLRASDEHSFIVRVLRARRAPAPSSPSFQVRSLSFQGWGLIDLPLHVAFSPAHPLARRDVPLARARVFGDRALREHERSSGSIHPPLCSVSARPTWVSFHSLSLLTYPYNSG